MLFVVIDEYSRYPEVEIVRSTSENTVILNLTAFLSTHGIPAEIKSDNGPTSLSPSSRNTWGFATERSLRSGEKPILSLNVSCEQFRKHSALPTSKTRIGSKNCFFSSETTVRRHIPPQELPLPSSSLDEN